MIIKEFSRKGFKNSKNKIGYIESVKDKDSIHWHWISMSVNIKEEFFEKFKDNIIWMWPSGFQELSEDFIKKFSEYIDWDLLSSNNKVELSKDFIIEMRFKGYLKNKRRS